MHQKMAQFVHYHVFQALGGYNAKRTLMQMRPVDG